MQTIFFKNGTRKRPREIKVAKAGRLI